MIDLLLQSIKQYETYFGEKVDRKGKSCPHKVSCIDTYLTMPGYNAMYNLGYFIDYYLSRGGHAADSDQENRAAYMLMWNVLH